MRRDRLEAEPAGFGMLVNRVTHLIATFPEPFVLEGIEGIQPAGSYDVECEHEAIDGLTWQAHRQVAAFIFLPAIGSASATRQMVPITPAELSKAAISQ